jgi:glycosyl-4,4'-diaponeurosporenoate acyltransferase
VITRPPAVVALALNVGVWLGWSVTAGYLGHRLLVERLARDGLVTRLRRFEASGRWYERRLAIRRWKDRLPEAGAFFGGGFSKRRIKRGELARFVVETRRAEVVHWWIMAIWPLFAIWNPPWAVGVMLAYAVAANVPCIVVQRYNRARLLRILGTGARSRAV